MNQLTNHMIYLQGKITLSHCIKKTNSTKKYIRTQIVYAK